MMGVAQRFNRHEFVRQIYGDDLIDRRVGRQDFEEELAGARN